MENEIWKIAVGRITKNMKELISHNNYSFTIAGIAKIIDHGTQEYYLNQGNRIPFHKRVWMEIHRISFPDDIRYVISNYSAKLVKE